MNTDSIVANKLTISHLALAKGWVNGLSLEELAPRYLAAFGEGGTKVDMRVAKSTLMRVLQELANAATRHNIEGAATLFRQAARIRADASGPSEKDIEKRPSFEEFLESLDGAEEFSESELYEIYQDRYLAKATTEEKAIARRSRLVTRQLALLAKLQHYVSEPMRIDDPVAGWFAPHLVERITEAGFKTISDLAVAIAHRPQNWFDPITGFGETKAARVESYIRSQITDLESVLADRGIRVVTYQETLVASEISRQVTVQEVQEIATETRPLPARVMPEGLAPEDLDGSAGRLRDKNNASAIEADNDFEAMQIWLKLKKSSATVKLYEREVTRLIAWSIQVRRRPMSSLSIEDAIAYRDFLCKPPPSMLIKKGPQARSARARAALARGDSFHVAGFTKAALKPTTVRKALVVVSGFFGWLVQVRYVTANPFVGVNAVAGLAGVGMGSTEAEEEAGIEHARSRRSAVLRRVLPQEATAAIERYLNTPPLPKDAAFHARVRFIYRLASMTGLRISEIAAARRDHLEYVEPDLRTGDGGGWILHVVGKRDKHREVPMPDFIMDELRQYLAHRGLITLPCPAIDIPRGTFLVGAYPEYTTQTSSSGEVSIVTTEKRTRKPKKAPDGVRPQTIHLALKELFQIALRANTFNDVETAEKMQKASAHWLRHTLATRSVASGVPVEVVQDTFGHANIATTSIYVQAERRRKMSEMRKFWDNAALGGLPPKEPSA